VVVPPGVDGWTADGDGENDIAGGIARLGLGTAAGGAESAGGILRFNLGERVN
jgi:hypothetical protein